MHELLHQSDPGSQSRGRSQRELEEVELHQSGPRGLGGGSTKRRWFLWFFYDFFLIIVKICVGVVASLFCCVKFVFILLLHGEVECFSRCLKLNFFLLIILLHILCMLSKNILSCYFCFTGPVRVCAKCVYLWFLKQFQVVSVTRHTRWDVFQIVWISWHIHNPDLHPSNPIPTVEGNLFVFMNNSNLTVQFKIEQQLFCPTKIIFLLWSSAKRPLFKAAVSKCCQTTWFARI